MELTKENTTGEDSSPQSNPQLTKKAQERYSEFDPEDLLPPSVEKIYKKAYLKGAADMMEILEQQKGSDNGN